MSWLEKEWWKCNHFIFLASAQSPPCDSRPTGLPIHCRSPPIHRRLTTCGQVDVICVYMKQPLIGVAVSWPVWSPDWEDLIWGGWGKLTLCSFWWCCWLAPPCYGHRPVASSIVLHCCSWCAPTFILLFHSFTLPLWWQNILLNVGTIQNMYYKLPESGRKTRQNIAIWPHPSFSYVSWRFESHIWYPFGYSLEI